MNSTPTKAYAVSSGSYSDYSVLAIFRRREDAERYMAEKGEWDPSPDEPEGGYYVIGYESAFIEEFDYYEGEPTPAPVT